MIYGLMAILLIGSFVIMAILSDDPETDHRE